jgi:hypothetical protein
MRDLWLPVVFSMSGIGFGVLARRTVSTFTRRRRMSRRLEEIQLSRRLAQIRMLRP